jgi:hypothetical protein
MNVTTGAPFSYGQLIGQAAGMAIAGMLLAALLAGVIHALLHGLGAWQTRAGAAREFNWWPALLGLGLAAVAGGWAGLQVGAGQAVVPVAKELGPQMLKDGFEQGLRRAGITNLAALDVGRMQELLAKAEQVALPPLDFPGADQVRPQIEAIRVKLLAEAGAFLNAREKQGKLALPELLGALWPKVFDELVAGERKFRRAAIASGVIWVVGIQMVLALVCLVMRQTRNSSSALPPTLPQSSHGHQS